MESAQEGEFGAHLKQCPACSELVSDLKLISSEARQLAATDEPAPRVWVRIAAELKAEGLIREPEAVPASPVPASTPRSRWSAWWLVPVAAALVAAGSYMVSRKAAPQVAQQPAVVQTPAASTPHSSSQTQTPAAQNQATVAQGGAARVAPRLSANNVQEVAEAPSPEDEQFLSEVSTRAPGMRVTYENQLRSVNAYIREAQAYLQQNPDDEDARQHLMEACQQKAMLYQMALDHVQ
jgi:hypothetical protein